MGIINPKSGRNSYPHFQPQKAGKQFLFRPQNSNDTVCVWLIDSRPTLKEDRLSKKIKKIWERTIIDYLISED